MSVWPVSNAPLGSTEGALLSISITVNPCDLENVLEALAELDHPINPQIYHQAAVAYLYADGREEFASTTIVEFPAYAPWVTGVHRALRRCGFQADCIYITPMWDELHDGEAPRPAPAGAAYQSLRLIKQAELAACA